MNARSWFRFWKRQPEGVQHVGVSDAFAQSSQVTTLDEATENIAYRVAGSERVATLHPSLRGPAKEEGFHHIFGPIRARRRSGTSRWHQTARSYSRRNSSFSPPAPTSLASQPRTSAFREQIVRSQRQWLNTFDSIEE